MELGSKAMFRDGVVSLSMEFMEVELGSKAMVRVHAVRTSDFGLE